MLFLQIIILWGDIVNFFNTHKIFAVAVKTTKENLRPGDILQIKGYDPAFRIYIGQDDEDNIILADMDDRYICTSKAFDSLFTGNAVCVKHQPTTNTTIINGYTINDEPLKKDGPHERFEGHQEDLVNYLWRGTSTKNAIGTYYWRDNQTMRQLARIILNSVPGRSRGSAKSKAWGIWSWMKLNDGYGPRHMYFHCTGPRDLLAPWGCTEHTRDMVHWNTIHSFQQTYAAQHGNCVEQARFVVGLARSMGCTARYLKVHGHVWAQIYNPDNNRWYDLDTAINVDFGGSKFEGGTADWDYPS
jgi:hypothetical protein